ncbi:MAG: dihydropteroate synthase [Elusimicrobia bacterium CG_4_10_14_3_um_filter_49_12_50_7]|nr:MAG: dihydropteroate synthase [Elusimicrobia bacterium CG03_land_8_20_14_0_80_50_18]PIX16690.1 MAG: dihydropteroate synthase [Elusimicrobia bacterium CG_4_8_14_3_um_filter_50_9]PIY17718.1 MAG: dihydropteroate synthase [Elusimicrobia bacterium CG_4_10_14_3_um_filter_49_12_50_7]
MDWTSRISGKKYAIPLGERTFVMGIINTSPDSFSGDGLNSVDDAVRQAERFIREGADILDVGGQSTRPGAEAIDAGEEISRTAPLIKELSSKFDVPVSIDTYKSEVARAALENGAAMINDISAFHFDEKMAGLASVYGVPVILMHIKGIPETMQKGEIVYDDVIGSIKKYLNRAVKSALEAGIREDMIILDPGIGFGKTVEHNLIILKRLAELKELGKPLLVGPSRKSFIGKTLNLPENERIEGTAAAVSAAIMNGADIIRVHDVAEMKRVAVMTDAIVRAGGA